MGVAKSVYDYELESWLESLKNKDLEAVKNDSETLKRKEEALKALKAYQDKLDSDDIDRIIENISDKGAKIQKSIEQLVYDGALTDEALAAVLKENNVLRNAATDACAMCAQCVSCSLCGFCFVGGVAAAVTTASVGTAASHAY